MRGERGVQAEVEAHSPPIPCWAPRVDSRSHPPLDTVAVFFVDALQVRFRGLEIERPRVVRGRTCQICSSLFAFWNRGFDLISGLEPSTDLDRMR
jgi:hypothetical protein